MMCQCCRVTFPEKHIWPFKMGGNPPTNILVCNWCLWMLKGFVMSVVHGHNMKIQWGNRSIYRGHWAEVKTFLLNYQPYADPFKFKVIEYGVGLTTELLVLDGYDVTTFEPNATYAQMCQRFHKNIHAYSEKEGPPALDQRFDFAMVDAPQGQSARTKEMEHAIIHSKWDGYIYMHDPEQTQVEVLERYGWLPMEDWSKVNFHRFYEGPK